MRREAVRERFSTAAAVIRNVPEHIGISRQTKNVPNVENFYWKNTQRPRNMHVEMIEFHATTICAVRRGPDDICIGGDGQVTMGEHTIMKNGAKKVRKIYKNTVVTGFAGSVADAFALTDKFEKKLDEHSGNLKRAAVDLAQIWRSDKGMRSLEALMIVADKDMDAEAIVRESLRIASSICVYTNSNISVEKL